MLEVRLLGQFSVHLDDRPVEMPSHAAQVLLAYLMLHAGIEHRREKLAGLIWPDASELNARNNLRHALWRIRKAIGASRQTGAEYVIADNTFVQFDRHSDYWLDVSILEKKVTARLSLDDLIEVVSTYKGEFLPGFYEDWVLLERDRLQSIFERKMQTLLDRLVDERRWADVLDWGEYWIGLGHAPEPAYRALMQAHSSLGDILSMAAVFQRCVEALRKELGVEPSEETRALYEQLSRRRSPGTASPVYAAASRRAMPAAAAPLDTRPLRLSPPHNLPAQPTPFVGRDKELAEVADRLKDPACRLLALIGPGGIGKTRLAIQAAAAHLESFPDGAYFAPLASLSSTEFLVSRLADALKFTFYGQDSPKPQLLNYLREKETLLVVDNFEHLLEGAALLEEILMVAPGVKILVTSRERLHLQWEWILEIEGLEFPESDEDEGVEGYSAVRLFQQTARRLHARFSLSKEKSAVVRICQLAEGMPLAIELAAAWVRAMPCAEIARQIEYNLDLLSTPVQHIPERHRGVRAVLEHSWSLLSKEERNVFSKLSVFQAGFRREAAEKVVGAPLSLLLSLTDKSFLRRNSAGRYELHELLRQYGAEKLQAEAEAMAGGAHALLAQEPDVYTRLVRYYLEYAQRHRHDYAELEPEWSNLFAGLRVAHQNKMWQTVIDYTDALTEAWFDRGRLLAARRGHQLASEAAQALADRRALAVCLHRWGQACIEQGDYAEAEALFSRSLRLCQELGERGSAANAQVGLARIGIQKSDYRAAERLLADSRLIREELGDAPGLAEVLYRQADVQYYNRNYEEAERLGKRALEIQQAVGDQHGLIRTLRTLAVVALHGRNDYRSAEAYYRRALELCEEVQDQGELAAVLHMLSEVYRRRGELQSAREQAEKSLALLKHMGDRRTQAQALYRLSLVDADMGDFASALQEGFQSLSLCRELPDTLGMMYILVHLGDVFVSLDQSKRAHEMWSEALGIAVDLEQPLVGSLRERLSRT